MEDKIGKSMAKALLKIRNPLKMNAVRRSHQVRIRRFVRSKPDSGALSQGPGGQWNPNLNFALFFPMEDLLTSLR